jgi:hypothetical protein
MLFLVNTCEKYLADVDKELNQAIEKGINNYSIEPYEISTINETIENSAYLHEGVKALEDLGIIEINDSLRLVLNNWKILENLTERKKRSWNEWTKTGTLSLNKLRARLNSFELDKIERLTGTIFEKLKKWNSLVHSFYVSYSPYKRKSLSLLTQNQPQLSQLKRLCKFRISSIVQLQSTWVSLVEDLKAESSNESGSFSMTSKTLGLDEGVFSSLQSTLKLTELPGNEKIFKFLIKWLPHICIVESSTAVAIMNAINTGTFFVGSTIQIGATTIPIFPVIAGVMGVVAVATVIALIYKVINQSKKRVRVIQSLNFDFSFYMYEKTIWQQIFDLCDSKSNENHYEKITSLFSEFEKQFGMNMVAIRSSVLQQLLKLGHLNQNQRQDSLDSAIEILKNVYSMTKNVEKEIINRARSSPGCNYFEHKLVKMIISGLTFPKYDSCSHSIIFVNMSSFRCKRNSYFKY